MKKKILIIALAAVLLDRTSKILIVANLDIGRPIIIIKNFFNFTYTYNEGSAWSMFSGQTIIIILITLAALFLLYKLLINEKKETRLKQIYYGLVFGGIIGNLIDRVLFAHVIDFLDFKIVTYNFPVFNIADISIVVGAILMIIDIMWGEKNDKNNNR